MNDDTTPDHDDPTDQSHSPTEDKRQALKVWPLYETPGAAPVENWRIALIGRWSTSIVIVKAFHLNGANSSEGMWFRTIARRPGLCAATGAEIHTDTEIYYSMLSQIESFPKVEMVLASVIDDVAPDG